MRGFAPPRGCQLVGWASAATAQRLWSDLAEIATAVGVADPEGDSKKSAQRLRTYLQGRPDLSVLVIDNAVDPDAVRPLLPVVSEPVYWATIRDFDCLPTCVVAGPNRRMTWLYVHATTPTVLRLHPPVVRFLHDVLAQLPSKSSRSRSWVLPRDTGLSHPQCVTGFGDGQPWLYVFAATPSTIPLALGLWCFCGRRWRICRPRRRRRTPRCSAG